MTDTEKAEDRLTAIEYGLLAALLALMSVALIAT
jgi:Flp pilus assembly pilin Flp